MGDHKHNCFSGSFTPFKRSGCPECGSGLHADVGDLDEPKNEVILFCSDCGYDSSENEKKNVS